MSDRPPSILIADDNGDTLEVIETALRAAGYVTFAAHSGSDAIVQLTDRRDVDVVLADVVMPEMTGFELAQRLKRIRPDIPVVLMTGYANVADAVISIGAIPLLKPFRASTLIRVLQDCRDAAAATPDVGAA